MSRQYLVLVHNSKNFQTSQFGEGAFIKQLNFEWLPFNLMASMTYLYNVQLQGIDDNDGYLFEPPKTTQTYNLVRG